MNKLLKEFLNNIYISPSSYRLLELQLDREREKNIKLMDLDLQITDLKCRVSLLENKLNK